MNLLPKSMQKAINIVHNLEIQMLDKLEKSNGV